MTPPLKTAVLGVSALYHDSAAALVGETGEILAHLGRTRGRFPAITHVDGTARVQTVSEDNGVFQALLEAYKARVGTSVLINTSFNVRGEPIVETPADAVDCFLGTDLDFLAIQGIVVTKDDVDEDTMRTVRARRVFAVD